MSSRVTLGLLGDAGRYGLATDLYELTMAAAYFEAGMAEAEATFELFVRSLPPGRGYLVVAGLEQALEYLRALRFDGAAIEHLRALSPFARVDPRFWEYLRALRFTGELWAMPEGTVAFAAEPLLRVRAPLVVAQLVETFLLATVNHQTLVASKAARVVDAAGGRAVVEFGARRAHGFDAAIYGARAAFVGGCVGTSNVLAGERFGIAVYGTAAHSFTMAFPHEEEAFAAFHGTFPRDAVLLIDTYDTLEGARRAVRAAPGLRGVRLDSGDLRALSHAVRTILDEAGERDAIVVASGDLDEHQVAALVAAGAPIDVFGVGTEMITSRDAPALGGVYKLVALDDARGHRGVRKWSPGKATWPEAKQVYRALDASGRFRGDVLALASETLPGEALLERVLAGGVPVREAPSLAAIRERARAQREALPPAVRRLRDAEDYPVTTSEGLRRAAREQPGRQRGGEALEYAPR